MQKMNWDDLRVLLAVARAESLGGAAQLLGLNATTVSRRVKAMEKRAGAALIRRSISGHIQLTQLGQSLADQAENMERHAHAAAALVGQDRNPSGTVRLTAVPFLLNRLIAPRLSGFCMRYPGVSISLIPDGHNLSLTRREVDVALRFGEPREGGNAVLAQKLGCIAFSVFTAKVETPPAPEERPWLGYDPVAAHLPQAAWTEALAQSSGERRSALLMRDLETVFETVVTTPAKALLPTTIAKQDPRLTELALPPNSPEMNRDVWLLRNRSMRGVERIDALISWLNEANLFA